MSGNNVMAAYHARAKLGMSLVLVCVLAAGCSANRPAPVIERAPHAKTGAPPKAASVKPSPRPPEARAGFYIVKPGDTLYSIALDHGVDYKELAALNNIEPSRIHVGQELRLMPPQSTAVTAPLRTAPGTVEARPLGSAPAPDAENVKSDPSAVRVPYSDQAYSKMASLSPEPAPPAKPDSRPDSNRADGDLGWVWPSTGKVISTFNDSTSKGIAIAGKTGQPVVASAAGKVIFSGTGIRGFGRLIVIKHNKTFLSVYAHNSKLLAKEGESVKAGQKIAEMGSTDSDRVNLHFEVRRFGKPVDPAKLLPGRP